MAPRRGAVPGGAEHAQWARLARAARCRRRQREWEEEEEEGGREEGREAGPAALSATPGGEGKMATLGGEAQPFPSAALAAAAGVGGGGGGGALGLQAPLTRGLERALEEAAHSGGLNLSGRKLKEFPRSAAAHSHDLSDTVRAGEPGRAAGGGEVGLPSRPGPPPAPRAPWSPPTSP